MVPPPRNYAADAHECIMGSGRKARRIQGCGAMIGRPRHSSPRDFRLAEPMAAPRAPDIIVRRQPHERRASSSVENPPGERGRACPCALDEGARLVDERRPLSSRAWEGRKIKREMGVISAHRPRPPIVVAGQTLVKAGLRPPPPAASALTSVWPATFWRRQGFDGQERASSGPPTRLPGPDTTQIFLLTKKTSYKAGVRDAGDWPHRRAPVAPLRTARACEYDSRVREDDTSP
jgi:hypothetical protein